jgi:hypothetical protein
MAIGGGRRRESVYLIVSSEPGPPSEKYDPVLNKKRSHSKAGPDPVFLQRKGDRV